MDDIQKTPLNRELLHYLCMILSIIHAIQN